jgi:hypothetical protein
VRWFCRVVYVGYHIVIGPDRLTDRPTNPKANDDESLSHPPPPELQPRTPPPPPQQEYISNPKATSTLIKMLKKTHPEGSAGLSLLPLVDEENGDSTDLAAVPQQGQGQPMPTSRLLQQEASSLAAQILRTSDIADLVKDLGYGCTASVELFRKALQVRAGPIYLSWFLSVGDGAGWSWWWWWW